MKKFICGLLTGVLICGTAAFAANYEAVTAGFKVLVNGKEFTSDPPALVVEGRTYLPLRAIGDALGVPVNWNDELGQAEVGTVTSGGGEVQTSLDPNAVSNYLVGDVWNDGFWFLGTYLDGSYVEYMDMYIKTFADSADEEFDVSKIVNHILGTKATIETYNNSFKDNEKWVAFYNEYMRLYDLVESGTYTKDNYDTTFFTKVRDDFCNDITE